jgi:hypothetical protein
MFKLYFEIMKEYLEIQYINKKTKEVTSSIDIDKKFHSYIYKIAYNKKYFDLRNKIFKDNEFILTF